MPGWVVNAIADGKDLRIKTQDLREKKQGTEKLACPVDGSILVREGGENLPSQVPAWRCRKCNWWWLPGDGVFELKRAFEVKAEYWRIWKRRGPMNFALPVVLTIVLLIGLGAMVVAVRNSQQIGTAAASSVVGRIVVMYLGENRAEMRFRTKGELETVWYKREMDDQWQEALVLSEGEWRAIMISGVNPGEELWLSIGGKVWRLTIGQKQ